MIYFFAKCIFLSYANGYRNEHTSFSLIEMFKALTPVLIYSPGVFFKLGLFVSPKMMNLVVISVGVAIGAYSEAGFNSWGVMLQFGGICLRCSAWQ